MLNIAAAKSHLEWPFDQKREHALQVVRDVLAVAQRPAVGFSGGLHSCIVLELVRSVKPDIWVYTIDTHLGYPDQTAWMIEYMQRNGVNWTNFPVTEWTDDTTFMGQGIVFKGLQHVPRSEWKRLGINNACRGVRNKWQNRTLKSAGIDYYFTGILGDEKPPRMRWWLNDGYVKRKHEGCGHVKPIAHYTMADCQSMAEQGGVEFYEPVYRECDGTFRQGDMGCWMCNVRLSKKGHGNYGFLARNYPELFELVMYEHGAAKMLRSIQDEYPRPWLQAFIEEYLQ